MEICPKCGRQLIRRKTDYYCTKDRVAFDKQTLQEIPAKAFSKEAEAEYDEAKRRFRANMKGLYGRTDRYVDELIERYEIFFAEKNYPPPERIAALGLRQDAETAGPRLGPSLGLGFLRGELSPLEKIPVPLRGPLTAEQERLTEARLRIQ